MATNQEEFRWAEHDNRLDSLEGRFPKNGERSTMEGHVHKFIPRDFAAVVGGAGEGADYRTLQEAHDAGKKLIHVRNGTYAGFNWTNSAVKKVIAESSEVVINGNLTVAADIDSHFVGVKFQPSSAHLVITHNGAGTRTYEGCKFDVTDNAFRVMFTPGTAGANKSKLVNCEFIGTGYVPKAFDFGYTQDNSADAWTTRVGEGPFDWVHNGALNDAAYLGVTDVLDLPFGLTITPDIYDFVVGSPLPDGTGRLAYEYWNGSSWASLTVTFASSPTVNEVRTWRLKGYANWTPPSTWTSANLNTLLGGNAPSTTAFWMRIRVSTAYPTTKPVTSLKRVGTGIITDYDFSGKTRRNYYQPELINCVFRDFTGCQLIDMSGSAVTQGEGIAGYFVCTFYNCVDLGTELLATPNGSIVDVLGDVCTGRALRLGSNNIGRISLNAAGNLLTTVCGEGSTVDTATANTLTHDFVSSGNAGAQSAGDEILIISGTGAGQKRVIAAYDLGTLTYTVRDDWTTIPDTNSRFIHYDPHFVAVQPGINSQLIVSIRDFSVAIRASIAQNRFSVSGYIECPVGIQSSAPTSAVNRPFAVNALIAQSGSSAHGAHGVIVDMSGLESIGSPAANAAEGVLGFISSIQDGMIGMVGKTTSTRAVANRATTTSPTGFGISGDLPPHIDNEVNFGTATLAFASLWGYIHGVRSYIEGDEQAADPAAPAANKGRLFFKDNGAGKTQLAVRFNTGATQVIATEP